MAAKKKPAAKKKAFAKTKPAAKKKASAKKKPAAKKKASAKKKPAAKKKASAKKKPAAKKKASAKKKPAAKKKASAKKKPAAKKKASAKKKPAAKKKASAKKKPAAKKKASAKTTKVFSATELRRFAKRGELENLERALASGADPTEHDRQGFSAIHHAALTDRAACLRAFHEHGFDLLHETDNGEYETAVHLAAREGCLEALRTFAELEVDLDRPRNVCNETPVFAAIEGGKLEAMALLLDLGVNADYTYRSRFREGIVQHAATEGQVGVLRLLRARGFSLSQRPGYASPLHLAVDVGQTDVVRYLIEEAEVSPDEREDGYCALGRAALRYYSDTVRALLELGADPDARDDDGTPAFFRCRELDGLRAFLDAGADVALCDPQGRSVGFYQQGDCLRLVAQRGLELAVRDTTGQTVLHGRHAYGHGLDDVRFLLAEGLDPNAQDAAGETPLTLAVRDGDRPVAELLIAHGGRPELATAAGHTALSIARASGNASLVRVLDPSPLAPAEVEAALARLLDPSDATLLERFAHAVRGVPIGREAVLAEACVLTATANLLGSTEIKFGMPEILHRAQLLYGPDVSDQFPALLERHGLSEVRRYVDQAIAIAARSPGFWDDKYTEPAFGQLLQLGDRLPAAAGDAVRAAVATRLRAELPQLTGRDAIQTLLRRVE